MDEKLGKFVKLCTFSPKGFCEAFVKKYLFLFINDVTHKMALQKSGINRRLDVLAT